MKNELQFALISVVIPCYLAHLFLERAVSSVLAQTLMPAELILVDDASPDEGKTKGMIEGLVKKISKYNKGISVVTIFLEKNTGPGGARNAGWGKATQPWIAFLDADDIWTPNKLALQYQCLRLNPSVDLLAHKSQFIKVNSQINENLIEAASISIRKIDLKRMLVSNLFPARSVILRSEIPIRFPSRRESEDYSLWLRIISEGYDVRLMDCVLAYTFRPEFSKGGYSGQLWNQEKRELHTLSALYGYGYINISILFVATAWSFSKFMRRILINIYNG